MKRSFACSLSVLAILFFSSGCIPKVSFTPNAGLIEELGYRQAVANLEATLTGVRSPSVLDVEVDSEGFVYRYAGAISLYWGAIPIADGSLRVLFSDIARMDLYSNAKVFLINAHGQRIGHEYLFESVDDGRYFCDLIESFKTGPGERLVDEPPPAGRPLSEAEQSPWAQEERDSTSRSGAPR
ncbi:MAG: hypothetical protein JKY65_34165 [Planctomycetes bacterium]|nr:hypothetical protein [Planctomycetota bacterium]